MEKALAIQKQVQEILGTDQVFLVGGSVRDLVMGNTPKDYDFTTSMLPEEMIEKVKAAGRRVYTIGEQFGTIGFKVPVPVKVSEINTDPDTYKSTIKDKYTSSDDPIFIHWGYEYVEVTTFRSEVYTNKSRKPEVKFVPSLDEDLARRDFTMNAMVLRSDGSIYDPYGGKLDIYAKRIKTVGLPKDRIIEDPLRILRAARFAARYGFTIDPNFIGKARQLADRIFDVSVERWVQELDKLLTAKYARTGLVALDEMGVLKRILPELGDLHELIIRHSQDPDEAWKYLLECIVLPQSIKEPSRAMRYVNSGIVSRFKFSNQRRDVILDKSKKIV
jgi:poly(A) polymerase